MTNKPSISSAPDCNRRGFLKFAVAGASLLAVRGFRPAFAQATPPTAAPSAQAITLPPLPYPEDALAPVISANTMSFHYGKHHKAYVDNLNKLIAGTESGQCAAGENHYHDGGRGR